MSFDELTVMINEIWFGMEEIKKKLASRVETLRELVWLNGKMVSGVINAYS